MRSKKCNDGHCGGVKVEENEYFYTGCVRDRNPCANDGYCHLYTMWNVIVCCCVPQVGHLCNFSFDGAAGLFEKESKFLSLISFLPILAHAYFLKSSLKSKSVL